MSNDVAILPEWSREWATKRLTGHDTSISHGKWNELRDWLIALPEERPKMVGKLHKLTMSDALMATSIWHQAMAVRMERLLNKKQSFKGDPNAVENIAGAGIGWRWVRILTPEGMDYEGDAMGHCAGKGGYDDATIYSLRDPDNLPHCTIHWNPDERSVEQIEGRANQAVAERYHADVASFVSALNPLNVDGASRISRIFTDGKLVQISDLRRDHVIQGHLDLEGFREITGLPAGLRVKGDLRICKIPRTVVLPDDLIVEGTMEMEELPETVNLGKGLHVQGYLSIIACPRLAEIPSDIRVGSDFMIENCRGLERIGSGLNVMGTFEVMDCPSLMHWPHDAEVKTLSIVRCQSLRALPDLNIQGSLYIDGCRNLKSFGDRLWIGRDLSIENCSAMDLPIDISVGGMVVGVDLPMRSRFR